MCVCVCRKCWEKVFYFLLAKYRQRHLENFNNDEEHEKAPAVINPPKPKTKRLPREHVVKSGPVAVRSRSRQSIVSLSRRPAPSASVSSSPKHIVTRPAPAPPKPPPMATKAKVNHTFEGTETPRKSTRSQESSVANSDPLRSPRPLPEPPQSSMRPDRDEERARASKISTPGRSAHTYPVASAVPQILLQEATPSPAPRVRTSMVKHPETLDASATSSPCPTPKTPRSPTPSIKIPQTGDAAMQRFFHDIVDQLQTMSMRSPNLHEGALAGSSPSSPYAGTPNSEQSEDQFEDADEDDEDYESFEQASSTRSAPRSIDSHPNSDSGPSSDFVLVANPSIVPSVVPRNSRSRPLSMLRNSRNGRSRAQTKSLAKQQVKAQLLTQRSSQGIDYSQHLSTRRVSSSQGSSNGEVTPGDKENTTGARTAKVTQSAKGKGRAALGLSIQSPASQFSGTYENGSKSSRKSSKSFKRGKGQFNLIGFILYNFF